MKKSLPQISTFKKTLIILGLISSIEILALILMIVADITYIGLGPKSESTIYALSAENVKADEINITSSTLEELDLLPESYDTLVEKFGAFSSHELTTFLRYGKVVKTSDKQNLTEAYSSLVSSGTNILLPQEYIDRYLLTKIQNISDMILEENKNDKELQPYITITKDSTILQKLDTCIQADIDTYLKGETCTDELSKVTNETLSPTLSFLTESLRYDVDTNKENYNRYLSDNFKIYTLSTPSTTDSTEDKNTTAYTNNLILDLDTEHIRKLAIISNYLQIISQNINTSKQIQDEIEQLSEEITFLSTYTYGSEIPTELRQLIQDPALNIESPYAQLEIEVSYLIKSMNIDNTVETFVAPIYIFSGAEETQIASLTFEINDNNFDEPYDVTPSVQPKGTVRVPIFMYHQIAPVPEGQSRFKSGLYVDPVDFEKQMAYLVKKNYKTISTTEYLTILKTGKNPTQKTVILTFDDGTLGQYTTAYPILKKYGLMGVFYIISQRSGINQTQTKEMSDNGMEIGSHSAKHPDLTKLTDPAELSSEIISSRYALQSATGKTVSSFCYPGCGYNATVLSYVGSAGYTTATSCGSKVDNYPGHAYTLSRVHAFGSMDSFKNLLSGQPGW